MSESPLGLGHSDAPRSARRAASDEGLRQLRRARHYQARRLTEQPRASDRLADPRARNPPYANACTAHPRRFHAKEKRKVTPSIRSPNSTPAKPATVSRRSCSSVISAEPSRRFPKRRVQRAGSRVCVAISFSPVACSRSSWIAASSTATHRDGRRVASTASSSLKRRRGAFRLYGFEVGHRARGAISLNHNKKSFL